MYWEPPERAPSIAEIILRTNESVSGLRKQKQRLTSLIHRHFVSSLKDRNVPPINTLVLGPTGGGKSYAVRKILESAGPPFIEINATQYSEVGYIGPDLAWMFYGFLEKYSDMKPKELIPIVERYGVVVMDEIDKWRHIPNPKERQPGRALQAELLRILEGDMVIAKRAERDQGWPIHTHNMMFIGLGAFEGLDTQMQKKSEIDVPNLYTRAEPMDIMEYGFMQELVGRFPSVVALPPLDAKSLSQILEKSIWPRYEQEAADGGFHLVSDKNALTEIAQRTIQKRIGARGFVSVIEEIVGEVWHEAQIGDSLIVDVPAVLANKARLERHALRVA